MKVAIIGGGPAGSSAAILLANAGIRVTVLESERFPRTRPGETLHPGVESLFDALDLTREIHAAGYLRHSGIRMRRGSNAPTEFESFGADDLGSWTGFQAPRASLDQIMLKKAESCGANVVQPCHAIGVKKKGTGYSLNTNKEKLTADYLLDATGRRSWLSRQLKIPTVKYSRPLYARYGYGRLENPSERAPLMAADDEGWTWIAPLGGDHCAWVRQRFDGTDPGPEWLPLEVASESEAPPSRGADVTWRCADRLAGPNWYLLGDAGAVVDPAASHGVLRAIMSGMQAAHLILKATEGLVDPCDAALHYEQWLRRWFLSDVQELEQLYANLKRQSPRDFSTIDDPALVELTP